MKLFLLECEMFLLDTLADKGTVNKCYINSGMHKWSSELNNKGHYCQYFIDQYCPYWQFLKKTVG